LQRIVAPAGGAALEGCVARLATGAAAARLTAGGGAAWRDKMMRSPPCDAHPLASAGATMYVPSAHRATAFAGGAAAGAAPAGRTESGGRLVRAGARTGANVGAGFAPRAEAGADAGGRGALGGRSAAGV